MAESFRISAILNFTSNAPQVLQNLGREFSQFDRVIRQGQESLRAFETTLRGIGSGRNLTGLVRNLEQLGRVRIGNIQGLASLGQATMAIERMAATDGRGLGSLARNLEKFGSINLAPAAAQVDKMAQSLQVIVTAQERIASGARETATAWREAATAMREGANALRGIRTNPPGQTGGGGGRKPPPSGLLTPMERQNERDYVGAGMLGGMAAAAIERGLRAEFEPSFSVSEAMAKLMLGGFTKDEARTAETKAFQTQQSTAAMGSTVLGNLDIMRDLNAVFHSAADAMAMMPDMASMGVVLEKAGKGDQIGELFKAAQAGELRGLNKPGSEELDTGKFSAFLHKLEMVTVGSGGRVGPSEFMSFLRSARGAGSRLSDDALFTSIPAVMMALKSSRAGTALQSWAQSEFGHLAAGYASEQERVGLIRAGAYTKTKGGTTVMKPGGVFHEDVMQTDPAEYILNPEWGVIATIRKYLDPKGKLAAADPKLLQGEVIRELVKLYPRSTITGAVEEIAINPAMIRRAIDAFKSGGTLDKMDYNNVLQANDAKLHLDAFSASWTAFLTALGEGSTDQAIKLLDSMTGALNSMANWARANPTLAGYITDVAAALGVLAVSISALGVAALVGGPGVRAGKSILFGGPGAAAGAEGAGGAAAANAVRYGGLLGFLANPIAGLPAMAAVGAAAGAHFDMPTMTDTGDILGGWNPNNRGAPGGFSLPPPGNSPSNPIYNMQLNQPSGADIAHGVTANQARTIASPSSGQTGFDSRTGPAFSYLPLP